MIKFHRNFKFCIQKIFPQYQGRMELINTQQEIYDKIKTCQKPFVLIVNSSVIRNSKKITDFLMEFKYEQNLPQLESNEQQKLIQSQDNNNQVIQQEIDYFYYEPKNLQEAKDFFNMSKLPSAFLFNRKGDIGKEQAKRFYDCYNRLKQFHQKISQQQIQDLIADLQIQIFDQKKYENSVKKIDVVLEQDNSEQDQFLLQLLQSYCYFKQKKFFDFRQLWSKMNHNIIKEINGEEYILLINLHQKFLHLWINQAIQVQDFSELQQQCEKILQEKNWDKIWNFIQIYEFIDTEICIDLLFQVFQNNKEQQIYKEKLIELINKTEDNQKKQMYRNKLKKILS